MCVRESVCGCVGACGCVCFFTGVGAIKSVCIGPVVTKELSGPESQHVSIAGQSRPRDEHLKD